MRGINVTIYVTHQELKNAQNGVSMIIGATDLDFANAPNFVNTSVPLSACEFVGGTEVRVNLSKIKQEQETLGKEIGDIMGVAMTKSLIDGINDLGKGGV